MDQLLYHAVLPENHEFHVSTHEVLINGISSSTKSNLWYRNVSKVVPDLFNKLRPNGLFDWIDFKRVVNADLFQKTSECFCFPIFTNKILVFDGEIANSIYDQVFYEENKDFFEEALDFDTGESLDYWIRNYWDSLMTFDEFILKKTYENPDVLLFSSIPKEIIKVCRK